MRFFGKMIVFMSVTFILFISFAALAQESDDAKSFVIAGAGPSTKVVELLAQEFCAAPAFAQMLAPCDSETDLAKACSSVKAVVRSIATSAIREWRI